MLRTRILTALVLLGILLPTLTWAPAWVFDAEAALFCAAGMWEWARLAGQRGVAAWLWASAWLPVAAALLALPDMRLAGAASWMFAPALLAWLGLLSAVLPRAGLPRLFDRAWLLGGLGYLILLAAWLAMVQARRAGVEFLLSTLAVAWVADISAYFGGRAIGGPKLAPRISPGKTVSGAVCGVLGVLVYTVVCARWPVLSATLPARVATAWGLLPALLALVLLTALSVMGDLFESVLKRHAGVKDSSGLLPGHGGVLDRIDALLPLLPAALLLLR